MPIRWSHARKVCRRGATLGIVALCSSCDCGKPKPKPIAVPSLDAVEIITPTVYSAPARVFQWRALVTTPTGRVIAVDAYPEITIKWSSVKVPSMFPDPGSNPVLAEVPATPGALIDDVVVTVTRSVGGNVSTVTTTVPGVVRVAAATPTMDRLRVEHVPEAPPAAVLIDAKIGASCPQNDWAIAVVGIADLNRNLEGGCPPAPELVVFSMGHEMVFRDNKATFNWSAGIDTEVEDPLPKPAFRTVSVVVGTPDAGTQPWAAQEIDNAHALFDENRSGIGLEVSKTYVHGRTAGVTDPAASCQTAALNGLLLPGGYTIASPSLFVLFVSSITETVAGVEYEYQGVACQSLPGHVGRVVYLSLNSYLDTTFAHELGHMFGLMAPRVGFGFGHANGIGTFKQDNLMWNSVDYDIRYRRDRFSLGQVFRMNIDVGSWLNNGGLDPSVVVTRDCQPETTAGRCPALDKDPG